MQMEKSAPAEGKWTAVNSAQQTLGGSEASTQIVETPTSPHVTVKGNMMKDYLGDSVYSDYSTGELRLYTDNGAGPENEIIITTDTLTSFFHFLERALAIKISMKPAAQEEVG